MFRPHFSLLIKIIYISYMQKIKSLKDDGFMNRCCDLKKNNCVLKM